MSTIKKRQMFFNMTAKEYREMMGVAPKYTKESKYHSQKTEVDGIVYDSKHEAKDGSKLQRLADAGLIHNLQRQVRFELQSKYINNKGENIRAIHYVADFVYERNGKKYVQDSKGMKTDVYKLKKKMFEFKYPDYTFIES